MRNTGTLVRVEATTDVARGVRRVTLVREDGAPFPAWKAGAHIDIALPGDLERQYSLCGDSSDRSRLDIAVLREAESRGGSAHVHDQLAVGDQLLIDGPRNNFLLETHAEAYIFVAGGIGITPMLPMLREAEERGVPWELHYAGRELATMAFAEELTEQYGDRVTLYAGDQGARVNLEELLAGGALSTLVYSCGPDRLLEELQRHAGLGRARVERFKPRALPEDMVNLPFVVELAESGIEVDVAADTSILEAVREAGVDVPSSCEEGTCGTCETVVLDGEPEHRDSVLSDIECALGDTMMICVSRACGKRLVLEL